MTDTDMEPIAPVSILGDNPESRDAGFGFEAYARTVTGVIVNGDNPTPLVIGIYGRWGSGKTTLMETVRRMVEAPDVHPAENARTCKTVWFPAWKYGKAESEILAGLIEVIFKTMKASGFFKHCSARIGEIVKRLSPSKIVSALSKVATGTDITELFGELAYKEKLGFYETFHEFFDQVLWEYLSWRPKTHTFETVDDRHAALVVFIDDLDRCPADRILAVLETLKLFMDKPGCVFVIGAARDIILRALRPTYGDDAVAFMEKIVHVGFNLPRIPVSDFEDYIERELPDLKEHLLPHLHLIVPAIGHNPRNLKRFINNFRLTEGIRRHRDLDVPVKHLLCWIIISHVIPELAEAIVNNPDSFGTLREKMAALSDRTGQADLWAIPPEDGAWEIVPRSFQGYLQHRGRSTLLQHFDAGVDEIRRLITLSGMVQGMAEPVRSEAVMTPRTEGMMPVRGGTYRFGSSAGTITVERDFQIDVYPVTNDQFRRFVDAGGYAEERFWSPEGWRWRSRHNITAPRFWDDPDWRSPRKPVVGVSRHEAEAFARFSEKRLPTEAEWELAARGAEGLRFPWGDRFDEKHCNTAESGIGQTTPVTRYPNGISPSGCYDMVGNVWEWTATASGTSGILKGGAWNKYMAASDAGCAHPQASETREAGIGFRCVM